MGKFIGYARISKPNVENDDTESIKRAKKQSTEVQKLALERWAKGAGVTIDQYVFVECSASKSFQRRGLDRLFNMLTPGDTVVAVALDRLARSNIELAQIVEKIVKAGAGLEIPGMGFLSFAPGSKGMDPTAELVCSILGALARFEQHNISERTKRGLALAKARGVDIGFCEKARRNSVITKKRLAKEFAESMRKQLKRLKKRGLTQQGMVDWLNARDIPAARGGRWHLKSLQRVIKLLDL